MKLKIGDIVASEDFGKGPIIAMTNDWCIYLNEDNMEEALLWDEIYIPIDKPNENISSINVKEIN